MRGWRLALGCLWRALGRGGPLFERWAHRLAWGASGCSSAARAGTLGVPRRGFESHHPDQTPSRGLPGGPAAYAAYAALVVLRAATRAARPAQHGSAHRSRTLDGYGMSFAPFLRCEGGREQTTCQCERAILRLVEAIRGESVPILVPGSPPATTKCRREPRLDGKWSSRGPGNRGQSVPRTARKAEIIVEAAWLRSGKSSMTAGRTRFSEGTGRLGSAWRWLRKPQRDRARPGFGRDRVGLN